jgi:hypothetical protein
MLRLLNVTAASLSERRERTLVTAEAAIWGARIFAGRTIIKSAVHLPYSGDLMRGGDANFSIARSYWPSSVKAVRVVSAPPSEMAHI